MFLLSCLLDLTFLSSVLLEVMTAEATLRILFLLKLRQLLNSSSRARTCNVGQLDVMSLEDSNEDNILSLLLLGLRVLYGREEGGGGISLHLLEVRNGII